MSRSIKVADIVVGDVVVALHHPGHQRTAVEIVDRVLRGRFGSVAVRADGGDAFAFDDDRRVFLRHAHRRSDSPGERKSVPDASHNS